MGARSEMGVPLSCGVILVAEEGLNVVQRNPVLHEPRRRGVPHDPGRKRRIMCRGSSHAWGVHAPFRNFSECSGAGLPHSRAAVTAGYHTRLRKCPSLTGPPSGAVNTSASRGRPAISTDIPSSARGHRLSRGPPAAAAGHRGTALERDAPQNSQCSTLPMACSQWHCPQRQRSASSVATGASAAASGSC